MAEIKYLDLEGLQDYDARIKADVDAKLSGKANTSHSHDAASQTANGFMSADDKKKLDGITAGANAYSHPNSGVTAGTYKSVTVNAQGHVTAGTNPTTLSGYGITDAVPSSRTVNGKALTANISLSASDVGAATTAYVDQAEADAKTYADQKVANLLENSTEAVDSIYELRDAMETNADAIDALTTIAGNKADKTHTHAIADVSGLQSALDGKAASSHGTHVSYSTTAPVMDGTASVGTATTVARSDHKHPTDTSRASKSEFDSHVGNKNNPHGVTLAQLGVNATATELNYVDGVTSSIQTQLNNKAASSHNQASSTITAMTGYTIASASAAIAATDSLNTAMGKLEKGLNSTATVAQAAYSYLPEGKQIKTISSSDIAALFA